jgi:hypothetical protein
MRRRNAVPKLNAEIGRISGHIWNALLAPTMGFNKRKKSGLRAAIANRLLMTQSLHSNAAFGRHTVDYYALESRN